MCTIFAAADLHAADSASLGSPTTAVDLRVELHWKSDSPRRWAGKLEWAQPEASAAIDSTRPRITPLISEPVNLTPGPILSGGILLTDRGGLQFGPPAHLLMLPHGEGKVRSLSTTRGGISFRIRADTRERLILRLEGDEESTELLTEIALAELAGGQTIEKPIDHQGSIWIGRLSGDQLRVRLGGGASILWTDEVVDVTVEHDSLDRPDTTDAELILECLTYSASDPAVIAAEVWPVKIVDGRLICDNPQWTAPSVEGAYRLRWQVRAKIPPRSSLSSSLSPMSLATSLTQSISEAMPSSLSTPFPLPLSPSLSLMGSTENVPIYRSEFSIAVTAKQVVAAEHRSPTADRPVQWRAVGKAEPREAALSVSRLLPRQTSDWLAAASVTPGSQRAPIHDGKRLRVLHPEDQVEYAVPLSRVGQRHRARIRIPTSAAMQIAVELFDGVDGADITEARTIGQLGPGLVITRSDFSGDGQPWYVASIDFWPRSTNTRIVLTNTSPERIASFESIEIQVAESEKSERLSAEHTSPAKRMAAMRLELDDWLQQFGDSGTPTIANPLDYQAVWVAGERLIQTLIREGYDGVVLSVSSDGAACYPSEMAIADASWNANWATAGGPVDALELLLRLFDRASLRLIPCIRPSSPLLALEQAILRDGTSSASIAAPSPLGGQLGQWNFDGPPITAFGIYNPTHPVVARQVGLLLGELSKRCEHHRCVSTIGVLVDERTYLRLPPIPITDQQTLDEFHASLGDSAPPRATIANWVQKDGAAAFERWHAVRAEAVFGQILSQLNDQTLLVMSLDSALPPNLVALGRDQRIITARLHRRSLIEPLGLRIRDEACNASVSISASDSKSPWSHDVGVFHQPLTEVRQDDPLPSAPSPRHPGEQVGTRYHPRLTPLLDREESSLAFAQLLNRSDRMMIAIGGGAMNQPGSEVRRRSLRCFSQLPPVGMADVLSEQGTISAVRVRHVRYQGDTYIYATNQTRWPISVDLMLSRGAEIIPLGQDPLATANPVAATDVADQRRFSVDPPGLRRQVSSAARWNPTLAAGELLAIRITGEDIEILNWRATFAGEDQQRTLIRNYIQHSIASLARLVEPTKTEVIANPGFEQDASDGIPGWLTAQYPPGCAAIDSSVAYQGNQSMRLTGQPGHAGGSWIVSQVITPPTSGRLAVSVRLRGEPSQSARSLPPLVVRMALEGTVGGTPIRKSKSITVPRDGKWSEPAERLEIALLPSLAVESLRLTIDLMSGGVVWVDEVSFFDRFMTSSEKTQLDHLVFLAAGGASRGDWTAASRLLDSHWALDLTASRSPEKAPALGPVRVDSDAVQAAHQVAKDLPGGGQRRPPQTGGKPPPTELPRPGIAERLKSWLPRPARF